MIGIVKTINGVKQIVPLTTDSGQGLPLGAWTSFEDDQPRNGYLKAGTTFNQADYPALYNMLGSNVVPDKGYGLDWDNAQAITLSTSDYVVQKGGWIVGTITPIAGTNNGLVYVNGVIIANSARWSSSWSHGCIQIEVKAGDIIKFSSGVDQQYVYLVPYLHPMFIKAVIGPIEDSAADQVVQNINNSRSYSTEERFTGKYWIDGKPIYSKTFTGISANTNWLDVDSIPTNIETFILATGAVYNFSDTSFQSVPLGHYGNVSYQMRMYHGYVQVQTGAAGNYNLTIEYTKTTD